MIQIMFRQGLNPDMCAVNVQNRVSQAQALLPSEVVQVGVRVVKLPCVPQSWCRCSSRDMAVRQEGRARLRRYRKAVTIIMLKKKANRFMFLSGVLDPMTRKAPRRATIAIIIPANTKKSLHDMALPNASMAKG